MTGLLTPSAAAEYLGVTVKYLADLRYRGGGPRYFKLSHASVRYDVRDLDAWLLSKRRSSTSDDGAAPARESDAAVKGH